MKKDQSVQKEALEIIELAIDDLTSLAKAFNLVGVLADRNYDFSDVEFDNNISTNLH